MYLSLLLSSVLPRFASPPAGLLFSCCPFPGLPLQFSILSPIVVHDTAGRPLIVPFCLLCVRSWCVFQHLRESQPAFSIIALNCGPSNSFFVLHPLFAFLPFALSFVFPSLRFSPRSFPSPAPPDAFTCAFLASNSFLPFTRILLFCAEIQNLRLIGFFLLSFLSLSSLYYCWKRKKPVFFFFVFFGTQRQSIRI